MKIKYDKDYYENGVAKGISGYENYRWIPELTYPMAYSVCKSLKIKKNDKVLEYGCAFQMIVRWDGWATMRSVARVRSTETENIATWSLHRVSQPEVRTTLS